MVSIALPKGRLGEKVYSLLKSAGYGCREIEEKERKLLFLSDNGKVSYFWVKPADVAVYVELGAADMGICGKDIIDETEPDLYELLDTGLGKCRMCVCAKENFEDNEGRLKVATKFPCIAKKYYESMGRDIDIIKLNGSIELAPLLGLSDVIVDIVETGRTLRENNLAVFAQIEDISARLVSNKSSYNFKYAETEKIRLDLEDALNDKTR
ncbi:MAG: ATP phosphoribosyltransferase [Clostridia bacterium]|nr:ATP phosphoribosyltransferase [Clostridia bacterium]